jgi:hypothetical protein
MKRAPDLGVNKQTAESAVLPDEFTALRRPRPTVSCEREARGAGEG